MTEAKTVTATFEVSGLSYELWRAFEGPTADGAHPFGALIQTEDFLLYGTTRDGGEHASACGTVFRFSECGPDTHEVVHSFTYADGCYPVGGLLEGIILERSPRFVVRTIGPLIVLFIPEVTGGPIRDVLETGVVTV
jgi:hypothetical protein